MRALALALLSLFPLFAVTAVADEDTIQASERFPLCTPYTFPAPRLEAPPRGGMETESDTLDLVPDGVSVLAGDVALRDETRHLEAARLRIDEPAQTLHAEGPVRYWDDTLIVEGDMAAADEGAGTTEFSGARYLIPDRHARGEAARLARLPDGRTRLEGVSYTTCDPGDEHWRLNASRVTLNHDSGRGYAHHVRLRFMRVPFAYVPWMSFPITDERMTGLLAPSVDISSDGDYDITVPVYLNLAPNYDATLAPRIMDDRGLLLGGETRYLTADSRGTWEGEYIDDRVYGESRYSYRIRHRTDFSERWRGDADIQGVSDEDYLTDMGRGFGGGDDRYHRQHARLRYDGDWLNATTRLEAYRPIDPDRDTPHQRLPQVLWSTPGRSGSNRFNWDLEGEFVNFHSTSQPVTGLRQDYTLSTSYPLESRAFFLRPRVDLRHTAYHLDSDAPEQETELSRTLPIYSLDAGIFLERELQRPAPLIQTLEPRLFAVEVPFEEQDDFPVFDTGRRGFSFGNMFTTERFTGPDRVGDERRLATAVTTRFIGRDTGREYLSLSGGQFFHFRDRKVQLPENEPETQRRSDFAGEMAARLGDWRATGSALYDPETERTRQRAARLQYQAAPRRLFSLQYRDRVDDMEERTFSQRQTSASTVWAWNERWHSIVHGLYESEGDFMREGLFGFGYDDCCWGARVVLRHYQRDVDAEPDRGIFFELALKGMTTLGGSLDDMLDDAILGYQPQAQ